MKLKIMTIIILMCSFLLPEYPNFEIRANNNPYNEKLFIHTMHQPSGYMAILDTNLNFYWSICSGNKGIDFKTNGEFITYFYKDTEENDELDDNYWIIADQSMNEIDTIKSTIGITDYHDMRLLDNGNYILQSYVSSYIDLSEFVEGGHPNALVNGILNIEEFDQNHNLIFAWFAFDHLDISEYSNVNLTNPEFTWMHGNSIDIDYDNNLILSNRRSSELIKIDRVSGEVIWIMGGPLNEFEIIGDPLNGFNKQHDARRLNNGNLLLFDNGNSHSPPTSRVVEYQIDEENKTATHVWDFINPYNELSLSMGSVQRLPNENTLINWGNTIGEHGGIIMEVNQDHIIVLEIEYPYGYNTYKVRKHAWEFNVPMHIGDANLDETVNILDVLYLVNYIFDDNSIKDIFNLYKIDINKDYEMDVLDIVEMVNIILY